jgi:hypothetical protein
MAKPQTKTIGSAKADVVVPIKGTDSIASIAEAFGAKADGHAYTFTATFELCGEASIVARSSSPSKEDRAEAVAELSLRDQAAWERIHAFVESRAKEIATARVEGETVEKRTWRGFVRA